MVSLPDGGVGRTPPSSPELSLSLEEDESEEEALEVEPCLGREGDREGGRGNNVSQAPAQIAFSIYVLGEVWGARVALHTQ